jgi:hypothetical protein
LKKLLTGMLVLCMVLGFSSLALAQTGEVSADMMFGDHVFATVGGSNGSSGTKVEYEAPARLTTVKGEVSIIDKLGVVGSFVFGKSEKFEELEDNYGELSNMSIAVQYQIVPMLKARAGFFTGGYALNDDETKEEMKMSGITIGAAVDAEVGNNIGIFGEAAYAPMVNAKWEEDEYDDSSMMAFEAGGKYYFDQFAVKAGYRYQNFDFKEKDVDDKTSATFSGFFVGASMYF